MCILHFVADPYYPYPPPPAAYLPPVHSSSPVPEGPPKPAEVFDYGHGSKDDKPSEDDFRSRMRQSPERPLPRMYLYLLFVLIVI